MTNALASRLDSIQQAVAVQPASPPRRRPADLIVEQRTDEVLKLIDQVDSAAYI